MKTLVAAVVLVLAIGSINAEFVSAVDSVYDYHRNFGILEAAKIKKLEEETLKNEAVNGERIVGGSVSDIVNTPYQAGLIITLTTGAQSVCGGVLISTTRLVSAAHCQFDGVNTARSFLVVLGSNLLFSGGTRVQATTVVMHPQWSPNTAANDIAMVRILAITFMLPIQPIALPSGNELNNNFVGWVGIASGFGRTADGAAIGVNQRLSSVNLPVIPNAQCAAIYGPSVHNTNLCTSGDGGRNVCHGDSGGPLAVTSNNRRILIGIASYVARAGCMSGLPAAFTRVSSYVSWILAN